ncbi:hypothetical protein BDW68DRAFT_173811 [Aspergillus falconensis]
MTDQGHDEAVGGAKVTLGFNPEAPYVIHTVGPEVGHGKSPSRSHREQLRDCYVSCLEVMETLPAGPDGREFIAFCCISTGLFAFPSDIAAQIAIDTVCCWCIEHPDTTITDIIFDAFLQRDFDLYNDKISSLVSSTGNSVHIAPIIPPPAPVASPSIKTARSWLEQADYLTICASAGLLCRNGSGLYFFRPVRQIFLRVPAAWSEETIRRIQLQWVEMPFSEMGILFSSSEYGQDVAKVSAICFVAKDSDSVWQSMFRSDFERGWVISC